MNDKTATVFSYKGRRKVGPSMLMEAAYYPERFIRYGGLLKRLEKISTLMFYAPIEAYFPIAERLTFMDYVKHTAQKALMMKWGED